MGVLLAIAVLGLWGLAVASVTLWRARRSARGEARRAFAALGLAAGQDARADIVALRGRLAVEALAPEVESLEGGGAPLELGRNPAARTRWESRARLRPWRHHGLEDERAPELFLDAAEGRVRVAGPVRVLVGSKLTWLGTRTLDRGYEFETSLRVGDQVLAVGRVESTREPATDSEHAAGYRTA
jgi:hypothetical protein